MRLTTWNCERGKDVDDCLLLLNRLRPDLVTLQECKLQDCQGPAITSNSVVWCPNDPPQQYGGVAVVRVGVNWRLQYILIHSLHPTVVPVLVHAPTPFVFVGIWALAKPDYNEFAWQAMKACTDEATRRCLPVIAAGDFNISPRVSGKKRKSQRFLRLMRDELGLVSAYHHLTGELPGEETRATYYHYRRKSNPFHIDYCFVHQEWIGRLTNVEVGDFGDFSQSDHRPLTVDFKD